MNRESPTTWDAGQYLRFERERTQPCRDLVARIELEAPSDIVDLGCGPGNSTAVLASRWPDSEIVGVDNSPAMLESARKSSVRAEWVLSDVRDWAPKKEYDLVFSNALLQWVPDHHREIPRLFGLVRAGGALAFQIPSGEGPWTQAIRTVVESAPWTTVLGGRGVDLRTSELPVYYDLLSRLATGMDMWQTSYLHVLPNQEAIVEWVKGTALRPILERTPAELKDEFLDDYTAAIRKLYSPQSDGKVLFPFLRRFLIAYR